MTYEDIINLWPDVATLANDLHQRNGVSKFQMHQRINKWMQRKNIPSEYWLDLIAAAKERRYKVSHETLLNAAKSRAA